MWYSHVLADCKNVVLTGCQATCFFFFFFFKFPVHRYVACLWSSVTFLEHWHIIHSTASSTAFLDYNIHLEWQNFELPVDKGMLDEFVFRNEHTTLSDEGWCICRAQNRCSIEPRICSNTLYRAAPGSKRVAFGPDSTLRATKARSHRPHTFFSTSKVEFYSIVMCTYLCLSAYVAIHL